MAASSLLLTTFLPRFTGGGKLKVASTRQPMSTIRCSCPGFQSPSMDKHISINACVVAIKSCFGPGEPLRVGTGIFLDHTLILTSAHLIGDVAPEKPDGCVLHRCHFAETTHAFMTSGGRKLRTKPLAVSFGRDLAILKVAAPPLPPEITSFPFFSMADFPPTEDDQLVTVVYMDYLFVRMSVSVGLNIGEEIFKVKAPWPLEISDLAWMEFDKSRFITVGLVCYINTEEDIASSEEETTRTMTGSPLFNAGGELVGLVSWERESVVFAASPLSVRDVVDYAKAKKPEDPIVMDSWIQGSYHNQLSSN